MEFIWSEIQILLEEKAFQKSLFHFLLNYPIIGFEKRFDIDTLKFWIFPNF